MLTFNGKSAVHKDSGGQITAISINKTGVLRTPVPYTNIAYSRDAKNTEEGVQYNGAPLCTVASFFEKSTGDEAGSYGGIFSGTVGGKAEFVTSSPNILINGKPAVREGDLMVSNCYNTAPVPLVQSGGGASSAEVTETALNAEQADGDKTVRITLEGFTNHLSGMAVILNPTDNAE